MSLLFRVDCNATSGYGHFSRCLNLARNVCLVAPGEEVLFLGDLDAFACRLLDYYAIPWRESAPVGRDARDLAGVAGRFDRVVVDSYLADRAYLGTLAKARWRTVLVSDFNPAVISGVDAVIDFTIEAETLAYGARRAYLGPRFYLNKPEFVEIRERNLKASKREVRDVLLLIGGFQGNAAPVNVLLRGLDRACRNASIRLVRPPGVDPTRLAALERNDLELMEPTPFVERLYAEADLVVSGGGLVKYESIYCAISNLSFSRTPKQREDSAKLEACGLTREPGMLHAMDPARVAEEIAAFVGDAEGRATQAARSAVVFDTGSGLAAARGVLDLG
jgi:spore coat polysaccharide biosynthesis predicted glycosyltransferase SpsG